jgi:hypothetical protein
MKRRATEHLPTHLFLHALVDVHTYVHHTYIGRTDIPVLTFEILRFKGPLFSPFFSKGDWQSQTELVCGKNERKSFRMLPRTWAYSRRRRLRNLHADCDYVIFNEKSAHDFQKRCFQSDWKWPCVVPQVLWEQEDVSSDPATAIKVSTATLLSSNFTCFESMGPSLHVSHQMDPTRCWPAPPPKKKWREISSRITCL